MSVWKAHKMDKSCASRSLLFKSFLPFSSSYLAKNVEPPPCKDDPFFEYGTFQWNGNTYTRTCAWLTENPSLIETRKKDWCDVKLNIYGVDYVIHEKCPEACDKCPPLPPKKCVNSPIDWHDSTGEEFNCDWYAGGESCEYLFQF